MISAYHAYKDAGGDIDNIDLILDSAEAAKVISMFNQGFKRTALIFKTSLQISRMPHCCGVASFPGASLHPYKLVLSILNPLIKKGLLNAQSNTPAISITPSTEKEGEWIVQTPRGRIHTPIVIHATNAHAATLLPELHGKIEPWRGINSSHVPIPSFSGDNLLGYSAGIHSRDSYEYLIQREIDGIIVVGGAGAAIVPSKDQFRQTDDSVVQMGDNAQGFLREVTNRYFEGRGEENNGEGCENVWTGIVSCSILLLGWAFSLLTVYLNQMGNVCTATFNIFKLTN